jgi:hypothetical protein
MTWLPLRPSTSRDAHRWRQYLRELEEIPDYLPGVEDALADARRWYKQNAGEEATEE